MIHTFISCHTTSSLYHFIPLNIITWVSPIVCKHKQNTWVFPIVYKQNKHSHGFPPLSIQQSMVVPIGSYHNTSTCNTGLTSMWVSVPHMRAQQSCRLASHGHPCVLTPLCVYSPMWQGLTNTEVHALAGMLLSCVCTARPYSDCIQSSTTIQQNPWAFPTFNNN